jgi:hypothetical protein
MKFQPAQQKAPESAHPLYLSKDRLHGLLAEGVGAAAFDGAQSAGYAIFDGGILGAIRPRGAGCGSLLVMCLCVASYASMPSGSQWMALASLKNPHQRSPDRR